MLQSSEQKQESSGIALGYSSAYPDAKVVSSLYLDQLRGDLSEVEPAPVSEFRRYRLPMGSKSDKASYELLTDESIELPTINYSRYNMRDYGVAYGVGNSKEKAEVIAGQLVRVDVRERKAITWSEEGCYPGEPVFVEVPDAQGEDDGVVLSVVLNGQKRNSFLLVLDAKSFQEIGRAEVPHHIPFGFHGLFFPGQK
jgi:beta,beta-carotene 9',10'-dioxygenase